MSHVQRSGLWLTSGLQLAATWIVKLSLIHLGWILQVLCGGVLLGVGPASVAAQTTLLRAVTQSDADSYRQLWRAQWSAWRVEWGRHAAGGAIVVLLFTACYWSWTTNAPPGLPSVVQGLSGTTALSAAMGVPWLLWVSSTATRQKRSALARWLDAPRRTAVLIVRHPGWTLFFLSLLVGWPVGLLLTDVPGLLLIFGFTPVLALNSLVLVRICVGMQGDRFPGQ